jgi:predicted DNA-binding transcriptional regulator YafY
VNAYFANCFGIIAPDGQTTEEVVLSFTPDQGKYIKSLPLHHSQQILKNNSNEFRIRLNLVVTFDFVMEILSYGPEVKIIEPLTLKNEIKRKLQESLSHYM